jgi:hypothetical protein
MKTPKGTFPYAKAPKPVSMLQSVLLIVCWLNPDKHLLKETFQESRDFPTHTHLSLLVPSIQFLEFPLDLID